MLFSISVKADSFSDAVSLYDRKEYHDAYRMFSELAKLGHVDAMNNLATMYQRGMGTSRNYVKAAELYVAAAKAGHVDAAFNYSTLARLGIGVHKNLADAYAWSIVAARYGASDLLAYRDVLSVRVEPEDLAEGSNQAEETLRMLMQHENSIGWLLPNHISLRAQELTSNSKSMARVERITETGEVVVISNESLEKITEENIVHKVVPSYKSVLIHYPLKMSLYGNTLYRPMLNSARESSHYILRPRRMIPQKITQIIERPELELDVSLYLRIDEHAQKLQLPFEDVIRAVQRLNIDAFEDDLPLRSKDSQIKLIMPEYSQVIGS